MHIRTKHIHSFILVSFIYQLSAVAQARLAAEPCRGRHCPLRGALLVGFPVVVRDQHRSSVAARVNGVVANDRGRVLSGAVVAAHGLLGVDNGKYLRRARRDGFLENGEHKEERGAMFLHSRDTLAYLPELPSPIFLQLDEVEANYLRQERDVALLGCKRAVSWPRGVAERVRRARRVDSELHHAAAHLSRSEIVSTKEAEEAA